MPIKYICNWESKSFDDIIDVRSPIEFEEDHMPNSINLPVLNDLERKKVGMIYKNKNAFTAKKIGASLVSANIATHIKDSLLSKPGNWKVLIYCWRGGQRSKAFAIILSEVGWRTSQLAGGYKEYRNHVLEFIDTIGSKLKLILISGKTGSAKTKILQSIAQQGGQILDLEGLANHKGSLLGKIPNLKQPSQKFFESKLYYQLKQLDLKKEIFVEAESSKIGNIHIPKTIWAKMIISPRIEIKADVHLRSSFLVKDYEYMCENPELINPIIFGLRNRLNKKLIDSWKELIEQKKWAKLTTSFLENHYDPSYSSNTIKNDRKVIKKIKAMSFNSLEITKIANSIINR